MSLDCFEKVRTFLKGEGVNFNEGLVRSYAKELEARSVGTLNDAQFLHTLQEIRTSRVERFQNIAKAEALINENIRMTNVAKVRDRVFSSPQTLKSNQHKLLGDQFEALIDGGATKTIPGGNKDISNSRLAWREVITDRVGTLFKDLDEPLTSVNLRKDVLVAHEAWRDGLKTPEGISKSSIEAGKAIHTFTNVLFNIEKQFNPRMPFAEDFFLSTLHNQRKVSEKRAKWMEMAKAGYIQKSMPDLSARDKLKRFEEISEDIINGVYGYHSGGSVTKRMAVHRTLIPKDAAFLADYLKEFGDDTLAETVDRMIERTSRNLAQLEKWGVTPRNNYEAIFQAIFDGATSKEKAYLQKNKTRYDLKFDISMGAENTPARSIQGVLARGAIFQQYLAKTGGALLNSVGEVGAVAATADNLFGKTPGAHAVSVVTDYLKWFAPNQQPRAAKYLKMYGDTINAHMYDGMGSDNSAIGKVGKVFRNIGYLNGLNRFTKASHYTMGGFIQMGLGEMAEKSYKDLPESLRKSFIGYEITPEKWEFYRHSVELMPDGTKLMNQDAVFRAPDELVEKYLRVTDPEHEGGFSKVSLENARYRLAADLHTIFASEGRLVTSTPGTRERAFMFGLNDADSTLGIIQRLFWQFKSATLVSYRRLATNYYRGKGPKGDLAGLANMAAQMFFFTAMGDIALQMAQGHTPEEILNENFLTRTLVKSGLPGIFGGALIDEAMRDGAFDAGDLALGVLGPTLSEVGKGIESFVGSNNRKKFDWAVRQVPGQNLFYLKSGIQYYLTNGVKDFLDPGWLSSMRRREVAKPRLVDDQEDFLFFDPAESSRRWWE